MGCSHAAGCPLFPLLKASLQGWRDHYCDSNDRWLDCARYQMSLTGERVPISLLPNGHQALHLAAQANWSGRAETNRPPRQAPQSAHHPRSQDTMHRFEPALPPVTPRHHQPPAPAESYRPQDRPAGRSRRAAGRKPGLWARFVDWMTSPS